MNYRQEDYLHEFLEETNCVFDLEDIVEHIREFEPRNSRRLVEDVIAFLNWKHMAYSLGNRMWISKRGLFEFATFVIKPTRLELLNGILIPGHRCVPFANPHLLPHEFSFTFNGKEIPKTTTESDPEEFFPYYSIFGEEYAPQYVFKDAPFNTELFNMNVEIPDPYDEDADEVSIGTIDMRKVYRESKFVPGDRFIVETEDWVKGQFSLKKVGKDEWKESDLFPWFEAAEWAFQESFARAGPCSSIEEQIACAYFYGGKRMRQTPAYALEEYLYEKTDRVDTVPYGIESRLWYAGRDIPDRKNIDGRWARPDRNEIEEFLYRKNIPISEGVIGSYCRDFLWRDEEELRVLAERIIPKSVGLSDYDYRRIERYLAVVLFGLIKEYNPLLDKETGPIRQRVCELHTAVIDLVNKLKNEEIDHSWLPKHTYIILSQIQGHSGAILEDLDSGELVIEFEAEAMDDSAESMVETYEDIRKQIDKALEGFRKNRFSIVKLDEDLTDSGERLLQFSIGGTDIWRRVVVSENCRLEELHRIIQAIFGWKNSQLHQFRADKLIDTNPSVRELGRRGIVEMLYEYGTKWTVRIMILSHYEGDPKKGVRCVAGEGAAPPEFIGGPLRFKRYLSALMSMNETERKDARAELGQNFRPEKFDLDTVNRHLVATLS